jgi:HEAT repeat protein
MTSAPRAIRAATAPPGAESEPAPVRAASAWMNQFSRTLKTCRLYDGNNPTVVRFREELAAALARMLEEHGAMKLTFTAGDVLLGEASLHPARSREDNLALPFFRDGVRAITLAPGIEPREVETLLDNVLRVSAQHSSDEDLVTLLWDADLPHVDIESVSTEGDVDGGAEESADEGGPAVAWPATVAADEEPPADEPPAERTRSDDRATGLVPGDLEAGLAAIESAAHAHLERFQEEFRAEYADSTLRAMLSLVGDGLDAGAGGADRAELARFIPRLLHEAIGRGEWEDARLALRLLRRCESTEWTVGAFTQELLLPTSLTTAGAVGRLDQQDAKGVQEFLAFATDLGPTAADWLMRVLAESQQQRARRPLAKTIAGLMRDNPERLAPWLADDRWYVVRNVVHILGWIGGPGILGLLRAAAAHPEQRVRREVVAALAQIDAESARPLLLEMLAAGRTRVFCSVLHQLSAVRDRVVARRSLELLRETGFAGRPDDEKRAILSALAATAGDDLLPELELELHKGSWLAPGLEPHRQAVARCIARIGTDAARELLARGAQSKRAQVRTACEDALAAFPRRG